MSFNSIGDLAQSFQLRHHNARIKTALTRLTGELASGRKSDLSAAVGGDFGRLASLERSLKILDHSRSAISEAELRAGTVQTALAQVQDGAARVATALTTAATHGGQAELGAAARSARQEFADAVGALNTRIAGQALFAGLATDGAALIDEDAMLTQLQGLAAGATTAADVQAVVAAYFHAPGGGYETTAYTGDTAPPGPLRLGEGAAAVLDVTAFDPELRGALAGLATGALLDAGLPGLNLAEQAAVARAAGADLFGAEAGVVALQARVGVAEERIERAAVANEAEAAALEIARSGITDADPFQTATELESATIQLETLFALTARVSRLSLSNFLR